MIESMKQNWFWWILVVISVLLPAVFLMSLPVVFVGWVFYKILND